MAMMSPPPEEPYLTLLGMRGVNIPQVPCTSVKYVHQPPPNATTEDGSKQHLAAQCPRQTSTQDAHCTSFAAFIKWLLLIICIQTWTIRPPKIQPGYKDA